MKVNKEIKDLLQKHRNAVQKIGKLQEEIQNLEVAKESLKIQLEKQLWDLNVCDSEGFSEVFDETFAVDNVDIVSVISFCESRIARSEGIVHYSTPKMTVSED